MLQLINIQKKNENKFVQQLDVTPKKIDIKDNSIETAKALRKKQKYKD